MNIIPLFVALPLGAAFLISLLGKRVNRLGDWLSNLTAFVLLALSVFSLFAVPAGGALIYQVGGWPPPVGICLVLDGLSAFMLLTVNLVAFLTSIYAVGYMERYTDKRKFSVLFLLMLGGMNGVAVTGDLFNLFVFLEIAAVASYSLVAFGTGREELEASFKYMVMGTVASAFILLGIALLYSFTSTLNMADIARSIAEKPPAPIVGLVSGLFIMGFGLKAALVPFHAWLPDAHPSAPAPVSALLSGVLIKTLGVYALVRIFFNVLGASPAFLSVLMALGSLSMLAGVFLAIGQWDLKRLLAYHSISQIGYVVLGIGLGTPLGILGGLFHLFNHSIFKSLLFLNSGAVVYATGTRDLRKMGGLGERMPVTGLTSLVASMSIAGVPPFNGFWSKLMIIAACIQAGRFIYAGAAVLASILTLASFLKVRKFAFSGRPGKGPAGVKEVPAVMRISMIALAVICLVGGLLLLPGPVGGFLAAARDSLLRGRGYANLVFGR